MGRSFWRADWARNWFINMNDKNFKIKRLVLVGAGDAHLHILQKFENKPFSHLQIYFISDSFYKTHNRMLPGYIAGHFSFTESHIDLVALTNRGGIHFIYNSLKKIDPVEKILTLDNGVEIYYDLLSLNLGSRVSLSQQISSTTAISINPLTEFFKSLEQLINEITQKTKVYQLAIVGAEIDAIEIALAIQHRVLEELNKKVKALETFQLTIFTPENKILSQFNPRIRNIFSAFLEKKGVTVFTNQQVTSVGKDELICENKNVFKADKVLFCTQTSSDEWIRNSNLKLDKNEFVCVNDYLQSVSSSDIFAVGDIKSTGASIENKNIPKVQVYATKQGITLYKNIKNCLKEKKLKKYIPQKSYFYYVSTGDKYAVLLWKKLHLKGRLIWKLKTIRDKNFIRKYNNTNFIENKNVEIKSSFFKKNKTIVYHQTGQTVKKLATARELSTRLLDQSLEKLSQHFSSENSIFSDKKFSTTNNYSIGQKKYLQSIHFLNECLPDPYLFGKLVANHCISSIYAGGGKPINAFSIVSLKKATDNIVKDSFEKMLLGANDIFSKDQVKIIGGHSRQGEEENGLGFSVTGTAITNPKIAIEYGHSLVLTKPLGTGSLLLALQQNKIKGSWYENLLQHFLQSNKTAAEILNKSSYSFCSYVAGKGFLDSIFHNLPPSYHLEINVRNMPFLDGFEELNSSTKEVNFSEEEVNFSKNRMSFLKDTSIKFSNTQYNTFFEPQTCGGFVIILASKNAINLVNQLHAAGYHKAAIVGKLKLASMQKKKVVIQ